MNDFKVTVEEVRDPMSFDAGGKIYEYRTERKVYEQIVASLDLRDLVSYLNRPKPTEEKERAK